MWRNLRRETNTQRGESQPEQKDQEDHEEAPREEKLEELSRKLIMREEQLFSQDSCSEEDEEQLLRDLEALRLQILMAVNNTFSSSSLSQLEVLKSAVVSVQQQEDQDRRWKESLENRVPVWRPLSCLRTHNALLHHLVESRLTEASEEPGGPGSLSSPLKTQVSSHL